MEARPICCVDGCSKPVKRTRRNPTAKWRHYKWCCEHYQKLRGKPYGSWARAKAAGRLEEQRKDNEQYRKENRGKFRKWDRAWRTNNAEKLAEQRKSMLERNKRLVEDAKRVGCSCGEMDLVCLALHHRDKTTKKDKLSNMVYRCSVETILAEIAKCDVLCMNCHAKLHAR